MKIVRKGGKETIKFRDLEGGDVFTAEMYASSVYIKVLNSDPDDQWNALRLIDGGKGFFAQGVEVVPFNGSFVEE